MNDVEKIILPPQIRYQYTISGPTRGPGVPDSGG